MWNITIVWQASFLYTLKLIWDTRRDFKWRHFTFYFTFLQAVVHTDLLNICSTYTSSLSWCSVFSLLMKNELYLPTVYVCLYSGSWGLLKWVALGICKRQYALANKFLGSNTLNMIFPSRSSSHMAADSLQAGASSSNHPSQPCNNGHYVNLCIWDFYVRAEEAVCITLHLTTVLFERLRDSYGLYIILCFKEENVMSFKLLQKSNASATKN